LTRLCGINLITLYGVVAAVGDVHRFSHSKKLVAYLGLNPSVSQSGRRRRAKALRRALAPHDGTRDRHTRTTRHTSDKAQQVRH